MATYCTEFNMPYTCGGNDFYSTLCVSSYSDHIAVSTTSKSNCTYHWTAYLEVWDIQHKRWVEIGYRNGYNNRSPVIFSPKYGKTRTYRVRLYNKWIGQNYYSSRFTYSG